MESNKYDVKLKYNITINIAFVIHRADWRILLPSLQLFCSPQVIVSSWPHLELCTSQRCRRKTLCPPTAASQSTSTAERLARAMEPGSLLWVRSKWLIFRDAHHRDFWDRSPPWEAESANTNQDGLITNCLFAFIVIKISVSEYCGLLLLHPAVTVVTDFSKSGSAFRSPQSCCGW